MRPWSEWVPPEEAGRRAGGRRHLNALRRESALRRRMAMAQWLLEAGLSLFEPGLPARLAARFQISKSTVVRDLRSLRTAECPLTWGKELRAQGLSLDEVVREMVRRDDEDDQDE